MSARTGTILKVWSGGVEVLHRRVCAECQGEGRVDYVAGSVCDPDAKEETRTCEAHGCDGHGYTDTDCGCDECSAAKSALEGEGQLVTFAAQEAA